MTELVLQDLTLKVRDIQVKFEAFEAFEADSKMTDCVMTEIDQELEKLEKRFIKK